MAEQYIFTIENLTKAYAKQEVLKNIWLAFYPGAKIGVIGSNGAGKSTLLRIMAGVDKDFLGTARPDRRLQRRLRAAGAAARRDQGRARQHRGGRRRHPRPAAHAAKSSAPSSAEPLDPTRWRRCMEEIDRVQDAIDAANAWDLDRQLEIAMDAMRLPPGDAKPSTLSGGERRRVALCKTLLAEARPAAARRADQPPRRRVGRLAGAAPAGVPRHRRRRHARPLLPRQRGRAGSWSWTAATASRGRATTPPGWSRSSSGWPRRRSRSRPGARRWPASWNGPRMAPRARVAKSKARLSAYEKLASQEYEEREDELVLQIPPGPHLGDLVVRAENVRKGYGDNLLMEDLNFDLPRGGIVGVIGPNGAGKTTLFRMIVGQEKPDAGTLRVGDTVVPAYVDQNRDTLDGSKTVFEEITGGADYLMLGKRKVASRGYVSRFNFKGPDQQRKVGELSGGERNRVHLAKLLRRGGNLLLLDEPTNDLDVDTLRALEEALLNFGGCAVVISHDRWFLDRIATHILAFEGDSKTVWCEGNYQTYEAQRKQRLGAGGRPAAPASGTRNCTRS